MSIIALFAALIALTTSATDSANEAVRGHMAPVFRVERSDSTVSIDHLRGQWVLLQFWSSADAPSRIAAKAYNDLNDNALPEPIRRVSVNLDRSHGLFTETVRRDGLDAKSQFFAEDGNTRRNIVMRYNLDNGLKTFLINPKGKIAAINPSADDIKEAM